MMTGAVAAALCARVTAAATYAAPRLRRRNFSGREVSLNEGVAITTGLTAGALPARDVGTALAVATAGGAGFLDDIDRGRHDGDVTAKGLHGHLGALAHGHVTTGVIKIVGVGAAALGYAVLTASRERRHGVDIVIDTVGIAATTNLINLFDLRPGRAVKVAGALSALGMASRSTRAHASRALATLAVIVVDDLNGRTMMGDTGANALGMQVGTMIAKIPSRGMRLGCAATSVALTIASEFVSFSHVIDSTPALRAIDRWGR